jgi:hypothetical protein
LTKTENVPTVCAYYSSLRFGKHKQACLIVDHVYFNRAGMAVVAISGLEKGKPETLLYGTDYAGI